MCVCASKNETKNTFTYFVHFPKCLCVHMLISCRICLCVRTRFYYTLFVHVHMTDRRILLQYVPPPHTTTTFCILLLDFSFTIFPSVPVFWLNPLQFSTHPVSATGVDHRRLQLFEYLLQISCGGMCFDLHL